MSPRVPRPLSLELSTLLEAWSRVTTGPVTGAPVGALAADLIAELPAPASRALREEREALRDMAARLALSESDSPEARERALALAILLRIAERKQRLSARPDTEPPRLEELEARLRGLREQLEGAGAFSARGE